MSSTTNSLARKVAVDGSVLRTIASDVVHGVLAAGRLTVMVAGCVTLLAAGIVAGDSDVRAVVVSKLELVAESFTESAVASTFSDEAAEVTEAPVVVVARRIEPAQNHVVQYLARRYRVADPAIRPVVAAAYESGRDLNIDPLLILAVMAIESSMNPFAESVVGAQGLMQVLTRVHAEKFDAHGGKEAALDPITNVKVGSAILKDLIQRGGSVQRGLQLYVGAGNMPDDGGYAARVLGEFRRLQQVARGRVDAALGAGFQAGTDAKSPSSAQSPQSSARPT